jgi:hypothetical protein
MTFNTRPLPPRLGVNKQCVQYRAIFALGYFAPSAAAAYDMEDVLATFVSRSEWRDELPSRGLCPNRGFLAKLVP